jgi:hypothetical protein
VFIVVFVLYTGNSVRYRFGGKKLPLPFWRLAITRAVLIGACVAVVGVTLSRGYFIAGVAFALLAWIAGRDVVVDKSERMESFYRALARADSGSSSHRFTGGPVGRWASRLREADYAVVARSVAQAAEVSDASADERLREMYDRGASGIIEARAEQRVQK